MTLVGLDLNTSRARAVIGAAGTAPRQLLLDDPRPELPLAISLQGRRPEVGRAGLALCRQLPHCACLDFLPCLGQPRQWQAGKHRLDASGALALVLERCQAACAGVTGLALALPAYLTVGQRALLISLVQKARLPLLGSVAAPLALGRAAHAERSWVGQGWLVDADEYALTSTLLTATEDHLQMGPEIVVPAAGLGACKRRLVDAISDRCIRHSRRDPRDSGVAEQILFDQLEAVLEACARNEMVEVVVRGNQWCQNLILQPREISSFCAPLAQRFTQDLAQGARAASINAVRLTAAASQVPGLAESLQELMGERIPVLSLAPDAGPMAAHDLATRFYAHALPQGHLEGTVALPKWAAPPEPRAPLRRKKVATDGDAVQTDDDFSLLVDD